MPYAEREATRLYYETRGDGEQTLLLIMGLSGSAAEWGDRLLGALGQSYRLVIFDNRGVYRSETSTEEWSMEDMAQDAVCVLDAVGVQRAHVLGYSMGGMIAQLVALDAPERVDRLVLASTNTGGQEQVALKGRALESFFPKPGVTKAEFMALSYAANSAPGFAQANPALVKAFVEIRMKFSVGKVAATQIRAIGLSDRSARVANIAAPTLVLHGDLDELNPIDNGVHLHAKIPGAEYRVLEGVGHMICEECPAELAEATLEFLER